MLEWYHTWDKAIFCARPTTKPLIYFWSDDQPGDYSLKGKQMLKSLGPAFNIKQSFESLSLAIPEIM